jgi:hypothetical protein
MGMQREPGLTTLLLEPGDIGEVIQTSSLPNLAFIASGSVTSSSGDLFLGQAFDQVLGVIFNQADASARSYYYYKYADYHAAAKPV